MLLWGECRGEPYEGTLAVACVVRNRVLDGKFGDKDIKNPWVAVMLKKEQFSCFIGTYSTSPIFLPLEHDGSEVWSRCYGIASEIMNGVEVIDPSKGALFYINPKLAHPSWLSSMVKTVSIGKHTFYRPKKNSILKDTPVSQPDHLGFPSTEYYMNKEIESIKKKINALSDESKLKVLKVLGSTVSHKKKNE
jgi:hypothetical protein